jgi:large subunit ribosomal protein L25
MSVVKVNGTARTGTGKSAAKGDRAQGGIPCVLYGGNDNVHFTTSWADVRHLVYTSDFKTAEISVDGNTYTALVKDVQFHPVTEAIQHVDFLLLTPGTPVKVTLPLRLKGQSPGVKAGGKLLQSVRKIKVKCLPEKMVEELFLDISGLDLGGAGRVRDIEKVDGIEIMMASAIPVVTIEIPRALRAAQAAEAKAAAGGSGKKK